MCPEFNQINRKVEVDKKILKINMLKMLVV